MNDKLDFSVMYLFYLGLGSLKNISCKSAGTINLLDVKVYSMTAAYHIMYLQVFLIMYKNCCGKIF